MNIPLSITFPREDQHLCQSPLNRNIPPPLWDKDSRRRDSFPSHKGRTPLAKPRPKGSKGRRKYIPKQLSAFFLRYRRRLVSGLYPTTLPFSLREMRFSNSVNRRIWFIGHHLLFFLILAFVQWRIHSSPREFFSPLSSWGTSSFPSWFRFWTIVIDIGSWTNGLLVVVDVGFDWV